MRKSLVWGIVGTLLAAASGKAQTVEVTNPAAGAVLAKGSTVVVRWTTQGISNPNWKYFLNLGPDKTFLQQLFLSANQVSPGIWEASWAISSSLASSSYYDLVVKDDATVSSDHSEFFSVSDAAPPSFVDDFTLDFPGPTPQCDPVVGAGYTSCCSSAYWHKICGNNAGQCVFKYDNVLVGSGNLSLVTLPTTPPQGAQIDSNALYGYGSYRARIQASPATTQPEGVVNGFYYYNGPHGEIDVELLSRDYPFVRFTVHQFPDQTGHPQHQVVVPLCFDPSAGFHTYGFDWYSDRVNFFIDPESDPTPDTVIHAADIAIPSVPGTLSLNNWTNQQSCPPLILPCDFSETCFAGTPPQNATFMVVDWVSFTPALPPTVPVLSSCCGVHMCALSGGTQTLTVRAGKANAGKTYLVLGSLSGSCPGVPLKGKVLPLVLDPYFTLTFAYPNIVLSNSFGTLNANGEATCLFILPPLVAASYVPLNVSHAAIIAGPGGQAVATTNAATIEVR